MPLRPINLQLGWPSPYLVPRTSLLESTQTILSDPTLTEAASIYGPDPGQPEVRAHIADFLTSHYYPAAGPISQDRILVCNGASANLGNVLVKFSDVRVTKQVYMVEPTYFLACTIFEDAGFGGRLKGIREDQEGLDVGFLEKELLRSGAECEDEGSTQGGSDREPYKKGSSYPKLYRYIIYAVPSFANPSGKTMSLRRRKQLVELARKYDALIITDDVYDILHWSADLSRPNADVGPPPPRLVDIDRDLPGTTEFGNAVSNGSFSKIVTPGIRVSWCEGTPRFVAALSKVGYTVSGGAPSQMSSMFVDQLLTKGALNRHLKKVLIPTYMQRRNAMMDAIEKYLVPLGAKVDVGILFQNDSTAIPSPTTTTTTTTTDAAENSVMSSAPAPAASPSDGAHKHTSPQDQTETQDLQPQHQHQHQKPPPQTGGFFTYLTLPANVPPASTIAALARSKYALKIVYGQMATIRGDTGSAERVDPRGIRLCWSWHSAPTLVKGVRRLGWAIREAAAVAAADLDRGKVEGRDAKGEEGVVGLEKMEAEEDEGAEASGVDDYFWSN